MRPTIYSVTVLESCGACHQVLVNASTAFDAVQAVKPARAIKVARR